LWGCDILVMIGRTHDEAHVRTSTLTLIVAGTAVCDVTTHSVTTVISNTEQSTAWAGLVNLHVGGINEFTRRGPHLYGQLPYEAIRNAPTTISEIPVRNEHPQPRCTVVGRIDEIYKYRKSVIQTCSAIVSFSSYGN
jgi:hypothetical protein